MKSMKWLCDEGTGEWNEHTGIFLGTVSERSTREGDLLLYTAPGGSASRLQSGRQSSWRTGRSNCLMRRMCTSACILWIMRQGREAGRGRKRSQEWPFCTESTTSGATGIRKRSFPKRRRKFWISCTRWRAAEHHRHQRQRRTHLLAVGRLCACDGRQPG